MKRMITDEVVAREHAAGRRRISAPPATTVITPSAWSRARELGVALDVAPDAGEGSAQRVVDKSGLVVVRGKSVQLGPFPAAGPNKDVRLTDVVTAKDGSPMTAGIMAWNREDSFAWSLDYDEVDYVIEGVLRIEIDGRALEGQAGDVFYIPKGSRIVFATPSRVRVFYVTYPADWAAAANPPARPLKEPR